MQLANVRVCGERPNDRMLSPARSNHKYAHVPGAYRSTSAYPIAEVTWWRMGAPPARLIRLLW